MFDKLCHLHAGRLCWLLSRLEYHDLMSLFEFLDNGVTWSIISSSSRSQYQ